MLYIIKQRTVDIDCEDVICSKEIEALSNEDPEDYLVTPGTTQLEAPIAKEDVKPTPAASTMLTMIMPQTGAETIPDMPSPPNQDPSGFFTSDFYSDNLIKYIDERTPENKEKPFFAYLLFLLLTGLSSVAVRTGGATRASQDSGQDITPHEVIAPEAIKRWQDMDAYEQKASARAMECFAGMVANMDQNVGKIVRYLKQIGEFENTFIIFQSDNGESSESPSSSL
ncbi:hypothetical protein N7510_006784 [Penicillium lagena]|uniref:uncharacterized protein n=1 Tax=Penicillium lagena TaxID=94218 RepID=UPI00254188C4|nr:uncharacterized protein N7510_006784 [Penicillium lagena]KAJ5610065.1 hypothetical protein N7510_006784 [Penicillium lagena]